MILLVSELSGLFLVCFGAATILPFQSEIVLAGMVYRHVAPLWVLVLVSTVGNTLGSLANYYCGVFIERFRDRRWFPVKQAQLDRAQRVFQKYGVWTLLLSWAPLGDALTLISGVLRTSLWVFLPLVTISKLSRYIVFVLILP